MSRALYRTYRSRTLDEVIGQPHITALLKQALSKDIISHAYLLTGPHGTGKTSVARILAHEINKLPYSDDPNLDIIEIDAASNRRIDDIRDLRDKIHMAPLATKYKVYIIDEVHMLTTESFNALLKTLEEPPEYVVFILATTDAHKIPATILSRTQRFHFRPVGEDIVARHLAMIAEKEHLSVDQAALQLIARHGRGTFRDSVSLLDQLSGTGQPITVATIEQMLGLIPQEQLQTLVETLLARKTTSVLKLVQNFKAAGNAATTITDQLIRELSNKADEQPELYELLSELLNVPRAYDPYIKLAAVLVKFCEAHKKRSAPALVNDSVISAPMPVSVHAAVTTKKPGKPVPTSQPDVNGVVSEVVTPIEAVSTPVGAFDWQKVLAIAKTHNAPLHSVLARAQHAYKGGTLTLSFMFALHRKKLQQAQYHGQLTALITDVCGDCPQIVITDGKTMSADASAVAAIMGGGEPVNAS